MKTTSLAVLLASLTLAPATFAQQLLGVGNFGNAFQTQSLYSIDTNTGAATLIGSTGLAQISGIAWSGSTMYAYTVAADLYTLDITTGASTLVASQANTVAEGDLSYANGTLYHIAGNGTLSTVNTTTAALTTIRSIGGSDHSGLIARSDGTFVSLDLVGVGTDSIVTFGTSSSPSSQLFATFGTSVAGLASDGSRAFATNGSQLFSFNPQGPFSAVLVGSHNASGFSGIAFIPAPSAAAMLALAGLASAHRRR